MTLVDNDKAQFAQLVAHLWRGGSWGYFWTDHRRQSIWAPVDRPPAVPRAWQDHNVYFGVHPTRQQGTPRTRSKKTTVAAINCLFAEFDAKDYGSKDAIAEHLTGYPAPSVIIDSGGGFHCYWLLRDPVPVTEHNRADVADVQARWVAYVGSDGGAKDLARVLRVPGTRNMKADYAPHHPVVTITRFDPGRVYPWQDLRSLLPEDNPAPARLAIASTSDTSPAQTDENSQRTQSTLVAIELDTLARAAEGTRNAALNRAAFTLGQLVGEGLLSESDVVDRLLRAGLALGLPEAEAWPTIYSGVTSGKATVYTLPGPIQTPVSTSPEDGVKLEINYADLETAAGLLELIAAAPPADAVPVADPG